MRRGGTAVDDVIDDALRLLAHELCEVVLHLPNAFGVCGEGLGFEEEEEGEGFGLWGTKPVSASGVGAPSLGSGFGIKDWGVRCRVEKMILGLPCRGERSCATICLAGQPHRYSPTACRPCRYSPTACRPFLALLHRPNRGPDVFIPRLRRIKFDPR